MSFLLQRRQLTLAALILLLGVIGAAAVTKQSGPATIAGAAPTPSSVYRDVESGAKNGFVILAVPQDQQEAIYCQHADVNFAAELAPPEAIVIRHARAGVSCDATSLERLFPGSKPVINPSPKQGWVITGQEAIQCQRGALVKVHPGSNGIPQVKLDKSSPGCAVST